MLSRRGSSTDSVFGFSSSNVALIRLAIQGKKDAGGDSSRGE